MNREKNTAVSVVFLSSVKNFKTFGKCYFTILWPRWMYDFFWHIDVCMAIAYTVVGICTDWIGFMHETMTTRGRFIWGYCGVPSNTSSMYAYMDTLTDHVTAKSRRSILPAATSAATKVPHRADARRSSSSTQTPSQAGRRTKPMGNRQWMKDKGLSPLLMAGAIRFSRIICGGINSK
jgi:hypothetical protein